MSTKGNVMNLNEFLAFIASVNEVTTISGGVMNLMFECKSEELGSIHLFHKSDSARFVPFGRYTHSNDGDDGDDCDPKETFENLGVYIDVGRSYLEAFGFKDFRLVYVEHH
jgi:hypothetical protein